MYAGGNMRQHARRHSKSIFSASEQKRWSLGRRRAISIRWRESCIDSVEGELYRFGGGSSAVVF
jgi:hypothetical protein